MAIVEVMIEGGQIDVSELALVRIRGHDGGFGIGLLHHHHVADDGDDLDLAGRLLNGQADFGALAAADETHGLIHAGLHQIGGLFPALGDLENLILRFELLLAPGSAARNNADDLDESVFFTQDRANALQGAGHAEVEILLGFRLEVFGMRIVGIADRIEVRGNPIQVVFLEHALEQATHAAGHIFLGFLLLVFRRRSLDEGRGLGLRQDLGLALFRKDLDLFLRVLLALILLFFLGLLDVLDMGQDLVFEQARPALFQFILGLAEGLLLRIEREGIVHIEIDISVEDGQGHHLGFRDTPAQERGRGVEEGAGAEVEFIVDIGLEAGQTVHVFLEQEALLGIQPLDRQGINLLREGIIQLGRIIVPGAQALDHDFRKEFFLGRLGDDSQSEEGNKASDRL